LAIHLGIEKIIVDLPDLVESPAVDNLARILNRYLEEVTIMQKFIIKIRIPEDDDEAEKIYARYIHLKTLCNHSTRINIILEFEQNLPANDDLILRYWGESVASIQLSTNVFIMNQKQYPVLSKRHQTLVKHFMRSQVSIILQPLNQN